jgi:hypothetical protein
VLVFRDEHLFREFRQGEVQGEALERIRSDAPAGKLLAFRFRPADQPEPESMDSSGCHFALHRDLQRALVAEPSETEEMIDDRDVDVADRGRRSMNAALTLRAQPGRSGSTTTTWGRKAAAPRL